MKFSSYLLTLTLLSGLLFLSSCGDVSEGPGAETAIQAVLTCDLNDEPSFDLIFEEEITSTWDCLQESMDLFIDKVRTDYEGYLSLDLLKDFINEEKPDLIDDIPAIEQFFKLSNLFVGVPDFVLAKWPGINNPNDLKEHHKFISKADISRIISFLKVFNKNVVKIRREFENEDEVSSEVHYRLKGRIQNYSNEIADELQKVYSRQTSIEYKLDLHELMDTFKDEEGENAEDNNREDIETIKSLTFLKTLFLGGDKTIIGNSELGHIVDNLSTYITVFYDFIRLKEIRFNDKVKKFQLFEQDLNELQALFYRGPTSDITLFDVDDVLKAASHFQDDLGGIDLSFHTDAVLNIMDMIFGVSYKNITEEDRAQRRESIRKRQRAISMRKLTVLIDHFHDVFNMGIVFHDLYSQYSDLLSSAERISLEPRDHKPETDYEKRFFPEFMRIASNYRFYQDGKSPYYIPGYVRNPNALFTIGVLEYAFKEVFRFIEEKWPCDMEKFKTDKCKIADSDNTDKEDFNSTLTLRQVERLIFELHSLLVEMNIVIPKREGTSANNATLMTDLFQFQSGTSADGSGKVEVHEATEFAVGVFTALDMGDIVLEKMKEACDGQWVYADQMCPKKDEIGRIIDDEDCEIQVSVSCFRRNFFDVLFSEWEDEDGKRRNFKDNLPLLHDYVKKELTPYQSQEFLIQTEIFARTCYPIDASAEEDDTNPRHPLLNEYLEAGNDLPDVPLGDGDMLSILGGLLNIESTLLRFDTDFRVDENGARYGNGNNRMDANEVERAYETVYAPAIKALVKDSAGKFVSKILSKTIFQYLIKYGKIPSTGQLLKFLVSTNKKVAAKRDTIAQILKTISETAGKLCEIETDESCSDPDPKNWNRDKCECKLRHYTEEARLKYCYPAIFDGI